MKKIYFSVLSIVFGLGVNAQSLTQANHAPANNDMFSTWQCDSTGISPGAAGAGSVWNYSTVVTHSNIVANYTAQTTSNPSYPSANIAVASSTANISYYNSTSALLNYWGGNISVGAIAATLGYTAPAVYAVYPMSLGTSTNSTIGGTVTAFGFPGTFVGTSSVTADGTGTLVLPNGTFTNVIRVKTSQNISFTVTLGNGTVIQENYDYYSSGTKASLFTVSTSTLNSTAGNSTQTIVTRYKPATVGIEKNSAEQINMSVYPNPSSSVINFATESKNAAQVTVIDVTGKMTAKQSLSNGTLTLDVSSYPAGIYIYKVTGQNNQILKTGKITVTH